MLLRSFGRLMPFYAGFALFGTFFVAGAMASPFSPLKNLKISSGTPGLDAPHLVIRVAAQREKTLPEIRRNLRRRGYNQIEFIDRELPVYRLHTCKGGARYLLHISKFGAIDRQSRIGACNNVNQAPPRVQPRQPRVQPRQPRIQPRRPAAPRRLSLPQIRAQLRNRGFNDIRFTDRRLPTYVATACRNNTRFRLRMNRFGTITSEAGIGRCGNARPVPPRVQPRQPRIQPRIQPRVRPRRAPARGLSLPQIRADLRDRGYREIKFTDRRLPVYVATACKNGNRFRLRMNRHGKVNKRSRIGRCRIVDRVPPAMQPRRRRNNDMRPPQVRTMLQQSGFDRITFIDRQLPTYVVRACKRDRRVQLRIDGDGSIRRRKRLGSCAIANAGMRPPQVRQALRTKGFSRILFTDSKLPVYVVEACRHGRKFELRVNRFARVMRTSDVGRCRTKHLKRGMGPREVGDILTRRGYREIDFFDRRLPGYGVTACKRGQKFRMRLNRFAEIKKRRRTGFCRPPVSAPPPVDDYYEEVDEAEIEATGKIDPETCQTYLDALVRRNRIHFDVASAQVRRGSHNLLRRLARVMDRCPSSRIEISGHTDSDGSREYNRDLSRRRASSVGRILNDEGVARRRMSAFGYGEDQPLMRYERSDRDKALNRRIEFTVIWGDDEDSQGDGDRDRDRDRDRDDRDDYR